MRSRSADRPGRVAPPIRRAGPWPRPAPSTVSLAAVTAFGVALLCGCSHMPVPGPYATSASRECADVHGAWIEIRYHDPESQGRARGEFLAVGDSIYVLTAESLRVVPTAIVHGAELATFAAHGGDFVSWTLVGILSCASHGFFAALSVPVWLIAGSICTAGQNSTGFAAFPRRSWPELRRFARFPQGLPPGIDRAALSLKPEPAPGRGLRSRAR